MEILLGLIFATSWVMVAPRVIADAIATNRMSKAGEFDLLDKERERRSDRAQRRAEAWAKLRAKRNRQAGGDGNYRPGLAAYLGDVYHGYWEDQLEKRQAKRAARPDYVYDPDAPRWHEKLDAAILAKVEGLRAKTGRIGRLLIDPVGEKPTSPASRPTQDTDDVPAPDPDEHIHTAVLAHCERCPGTVASYRADGDRWCNQCGWLSEHLRSEKEVHNSRPPCRRPGCFDGRIIGTRQWPGDPTSSDTADQNCDRCGWLSSHTTGKTWDQMSDDFRARQPARPVVYLPTQPATTSSIQPTSEGDTTVNTATGDVHDVESCKNECTALFDDLTRIDTALDVIDEAIRSGGAATERIEAWLASKNADSAVPGMRAAMDALSADRVKELMDAVTAAKKGVQDTLDSLIPLEEANALVGSADGSILNGR
jgi:hypothetical protein